MIFLQENSGEVYLENLHSNDPHSSISTWFLVFQGNFTISKTIFDKGNFNQILSASSGKISIFDCQIINSILSQNSFDFSQGIMFAFFNNVTFFNNSLSSSFIYFFGTTNSSVILSSLNFSTNNPSSSTFSCYYIYISSGQNNTISFQNFLVFSNSDSSNIFFFYFIIFKLIIIKLEVIC